MNLEKIEKALYRAQKIKRNLEIMNDGTTNLELKVLCKDNWSKIEFEPRSKAILNMVIHQIKMDLESELNECNLIIKQIANHE